MPYEKLQTVMSNIIAISKIGKLKTCAFLIMGATFAGFPITFSK